MLTKSLAVSEARDLGLLFVENDVKMIGQDGAYSIPITSEETLWVFGDTFIGTYDEMGRRKVEHMPSNTALICRSKNAAHGLTDFTYATDSDGNIRQLIPFSEDENPKHYRIWGMDGIHVDNKVYLYYVLVHLLPKKEWPFKFEMVGSGLAVADYPDLIFRRITHNNTTILWDKKSPCYGVGVLPVSEDGYVYLYGSYYKRKKHFCSLARVRRDRIEDISSYEYLISPEPEWSTQYDNSISIMDGMPTEMSVSYNPYLECYLAVHSWETSGMLVGRTAPTPWGPWTKPTALWKPKLALRNPLIYNGPVVYAGKEHHELAQQNGKIIYATYVEFEDYFPRLIEITLE